MWDIPPLTSSGQGWPVTMPEHQCPGSSSRRTRIILSLLTTSLTYTYENHPSSFSLRSRKSWTSGMLGRMRKRLFWNSGRLLTVVAPYTKLGISWIGQGKKNGKGRKEWDRLTWIPIQVPHQTSRPLPRSTHCMEQKGPDTNFHS